MGDTAGVDDLPVFRIAQAKSASQSERCNVMQYETDDADEQ
jgi:hypothetical protein